MQNRISEIKIVPLTQNNGFVGIASFVFDNCFYMGSIGIVTKNDGGYRLLYPTRQGKNGVSYSVCHPTDPVVGEAIERIIIAQYEATVRN